MMMIVWMKLESVTEINAHEFGFYNAHCFKTQVSQIGSVEVNYYEVAALKAYYEYVNRKHIQHPIFYIIACRIVHLLGISIKNPSIRR